MKKRIWILSILLACLAFVLCACTQVPDEPGPDEGNKVTATLRKTSAELNVDETVKLVVDVSDSNAEIGWKVSDETIVEIVTKDANSATVKGLKGGNATVSVTYQDEVLATCEITVIEEVKSKLTLLVPTGKLILQGSGRQATVRAIADDGLTGEVKWTLSDDTVATIENQGFIAIVKALKPGRTTVTVTCGDESASFTLIVGKYS